MYSYTFLIFEEFFIPTTLVGFFFFTFTRSLFLLGDHFSSNPLFEKRKIKYINQFNSFINKLTPLILIFYTVLIFKNSLVILNINEDKNLKVYLPILYIVLYIFLKVCESIYLSLEGYNNTNNQNFNSSGTFLLTFIPIATLMIESSDIINLLLPLELLGFLFYFIFLELSFLSQNKINSARNRNKTIVRGLMYFFWLNFIGTLLFIVTIVLIYSWSFSTEWSNIYYFSSTPQNSQNLNKTISGFIFLAITIKTGGIFFFFFKSDLYKLLPFYGILIFSIFTSIFYLLLLFYIAAKLPFFLFYCKWFISGILTISTISLLFVGGLNIKNIYLFTGFSSVLTLCFCILILI